MQKAFFESLFRDTPEETRTQFLAALTVMDRNLDTILKEEL